MKKILLATAAIALVAGIAFTESADAQGRGGRSDREALTVNQIVARTDARTARIKADLRLTSEQEKNWADFEAAVRDIGKNRADRVVAFRADRGQRKQSGDVIEYLSNHAKFLGERSVDLKRLADAAQPLYASLDEQQKRRFGSQLMRFNRERDID